LPLVTVGVPLVIATSQPLASAASVDASEGADRPAISLLRATQ